VCKILRDHLGGTDLAIQREGGAAAGGSAAIGDVRITRPCPAPSPLRPLQLAKATPRSNNSQQHTICHKVKSLIGLERPGTAIFAGSGEISLTPSIDLERHALRQYQLCEDSANDSSVITVMPVLAIRGSGEI